MRSLSLILISIQCVFKVIVRRIFKITASPENFLNQNKLFGAIKIFMSVFLEKFYGEFIYEHFV